MRQPNGKAATSLATAAESKTVPGMQVDDSEGGAETSEPRPEPEVLERPTRRHYSARYKLRVLEQTDDLAEGQIGAFLRREGLYWSIFATWRRQREEGTLAGLEPRVRGRKPSPAANPEARRVRELEKEVDKLQVRLDQALLVLDIQKKVLSLCGLAAADEKTSSPS